MRGRAYRIAGLDGLVSVVNLLSFRRDPDHQANGERRMQLVVRDFVIESTDTSASILTTVVYDCMMMENA